jgi:hypothetical protein
VSYIAATDWFHHCHACCSAKPKLPFQFCDACLASAAHDHPVSRQRSAACSVKKMHSFAASLQNRFTAFAERVVISFPSEAFVQSESPLCGDVPPQCSLTYGQVLQLRGFAFECSAGKYR